MAERGDFTDDEWFELRSAPWRAAMGVIEVDPSGGIAAGHETEAVEAVLAGTQFREDLVGLVTRAVQDLDRVGAEDEPSSAHVAASFEVDGDESFPDRAIEAMEALNPILDAKVEDGEAAAFRQWLVDIATAAAEAGKEGFAGLTGPKVSDEESDYLTRLRAALGVT